MFLLPQLPPSSWALRITSFTYILRHAQLLSSTLVSCGVMFGYQCFIFIHREFSNIAYYIYTRTHTYMYTHIHKQPFSLSQTALLCGEGDESPSVPQPAKPELQGVERRAATCSDHPRAWAFPGKGFVQLATFFLSFLHVYPRPPNLCTKAVIGNVGK